MAPNKRSNSPTNPPNWLSELLAEIQRLRHDMYRQESGIREIRAISLENQLLLRSRPSTSPITRTIQNDQLSANNINTLPQVRSAIIRPSTSRQAIARTTSSRVTLANNAIRDSAMPIPRPSIPSPENIHRICWYHRQFGAASAHCIQPCTFVVPPAVKPSKNSAKTSPTVTTTPPSQSNATIRHPLERKRRDEPSTSRQAMIENNNTDWNELVETEYKRSTLSESSSSSESSSDDSQEEDKNKSISKNKPAK